MGGEPTQDRAESRGHGFSSQSHFTGRFREITGLTPLRYRNARS